MAFNHADQAPDQQQELLDGRYLLGERLGRGGTGAVRRAHDTVLQRDVAVKLLHPGNRDDAQHRDRLRAEARLAGVLQHPGIARIFDYGEADGDAHQPYIVMELVDGTSLSQLLKQQGTLSAARTLDLIGQMAVSLQVAHDAGIVHRDLKPGNVMVTDRGRVVLVDFGIARSTEGHSLTNPGIVVGTADYLSPEQARGEPALPASDLYSLGMVAYECLTGTRPFRRDSIAATALAHLRDPVPELPAEHPERVRRLVHALVAKHPDDRPADARSVVVEAAACSRDALPAVQTAAAGAGLAGAVAPKRDPRRPSSLRGSVRRTRRRRWAAGVVAAASLVAVPLTQLVGAEGETVPPASAGDPAQADAGFLVRVPRERLVGQSYDQAAAALERLGLQATRRTAAAAAGSSPGTVVEVASRPRVRARNPVTLVVAR